MTRSPKKLIEVALPLDDINVAAAREKSIRHGHPSTLHLWWARRPLAAARAVIFAQMVNDPGGERGWGKGKTKVQAAEERERLFDIIRDLVKWENTTNEDVLERARAEIRRSWRETCELNKGQPGFDPDKLPGFHDPFAGGGALPLEAQRLGLEAYASDLNPVAVLINKAMIEIPPKFAGRPPINPDARERVGGTSGSWRGAQGLAEDVRYYGSWMRDQAVTRIGHLYPKVKAVQNADGTWRHATAAQTATTGAPASSRAQGKAQNLTVIAWLWARTVKSPNPAFSHVDVPLISTFWLSTKPGKEAYLEPVIAGDTYCFEVRTGAPPDAARTKAGTTAGKRHAFRCLMSDTPITYDHIRAEGKAGRMGARLLAVVAEGPRGRVYLPALAEHEAIAQSARPTWRPETPLPNNPRDFKTPNYGLATFGDLFTPRQLVALTTFSDLVQEARAKVLEDAKSAGLADDGKGLDAGGTGPTAYADAVAVYLAFVLDKAADLGNSLSAWEPVAQCPRHLFGRQAIPMVWDFAEANPLSGSSGAWNVFVDGLCGAMAKVFASTRSDYPGHAEHADARGQSVSVAKTISTDPPYYDNIGYADLSDFFYVWLRRSLRSVFPNLFAGMTVPKAEELVATPYRHGGKDRAEVFFLDGMTRALRNLAERAHPAFPVTVYYAFKQSETGETGTTSAGWETFLGAVLRAGFAITGTWPLRTENSSRLIGQDTNALASSIVLVCRRREVEAPSISRREFIRELKETLPPAIEDMTRGVGTVAPVAAVDLAQAVVGPGMGVFSKYRAVLEANGEPMSVHTALIVINSYLPGDPDAFDADTRFCLAWFEEYGWTENAFGQADVLARAKGTSVDRVKLAGVVAAGSGKVRLLRPAEYPSDWDPERDKVTPVWEALHHLIRALRTKGESAAGGLLARMPERADPVRQLAYRLYTLCERQDWADDARAYNELIASWDHIDREATQTGRKGEQPELGLDG
ncbi:MAG: hypothetical protein A3K19_10280 [Lentisphaerae bacterium RIFOXYB12_FULL_65_16]|nr:MAG: hypothetical protein A3K18_32140 [Lentisphaerae bacterium RIFOXYA12_64_32]OGV91603.1 MAG: hypothetical protein A3K19_10280 [Lentisphaerae bacterium RIFOXYB12_FULL_65_16]